MAEIAASFLLNQLTVLLQQEKELLGGIGDNAVYIKDQLGQMKAFLRAADEKEETDPQLREWVKQVRDISYDTEDVLETYMLKLARLRRDADGNKRYIRKMCAPVKRLMLRHQTASEFQSIKSRMENVSKTQMTFKGVYDFKDEGSSSSTYDTRGDALLLEESEVLGIEKPKKQLVEWLKQTNDGLMVISVVGMGGLGKTTLVKKIYDDESVRANFDSHVWITVSQNFNLEIILRDMITKLTSEVEHVFKFLKFLSTLKEMNGDEMKEYVFKFLKDKTHMIVLDDIWKIDAWESIRYAFPRNNARGRIIITTRSYNVGNAASCETCGHLYNLDPLDAEISEKLFYRKAFPRSSCPPYLKEISESILKRCNGLPLAIAVIGGLLATKKDSIEEWKMFERSIGLELQEDSLKRMNRLLSLSYYDLSYYLKACYLYLSIFPEDHSFLSDDIIRLWIAEGFVESKYGKTLEEVAESYVNELINRNLIQVEQTNSCGRSYRLRIHDILREYIISRSREQNLLTVTSEGETMCADKVRRMAIHSRFKEFATVKYLRSLFWFGNGKYSELERDFHNVLGQCRLLNVLNLRNAPLFIIPEDVFKLYNLRYLNLEATNIEVIPISIGNLQNLETLNLDGSEVRELPIEILKLRKLRHLLRWRGLKAPYEIGTYLTSLQSLYLIDADGGGIKTVEEVGKLTQLRELGIKNLREEDGRDLCLSLVKLTNLRDHSLSSLPLPFLRRITLFGRLEKFPQWVSSLHGLTVLHLFRSELSEDPLQHLEDLPNLLHLNVNFRSYKGEEMIFKDGKFQKLERLSLSGLKGLRFVRVEKDSMPRLKKLELNYCRQMEELPVGIEHLSNLQHLDICGMWEKFNKRMVEQKHKLAHIPRIRVLCWDQVLNKSRTILGSE